MIRRFRNDRRARYNRRSILIETSIALTSAVGGRSRRAFTSLARELIETCPRPQRPVAIHFAFTSLRLLRIGDGIRARVGIVALNAIECRWMKKVRS